MDTHYFNNNNNNTFQDFRAGVEYIINKSLGNCTTIALNGDGYDTITTPDGHYTIKDPLFLFGITDAANLTYHGVVSGFVCVCVCV